MKNLSDMTIGELMKTPITDIIHPYFFYVAIAILGSIFIVSTIKIIFFLRK